MIDRYSYQSALAASEIPHWRIEDIVGGEKRLDFDRPFMPESLARVEQLSFLSDDEKRILNQIRGHAYLSIFGLVEEFILPFVLDPRPQLQVMTIASCIASTAGEEAALPTLRVSASLKMALAQTARLLVHEAIAANSRARSAQRCDNNAATAASLR